MLRTESAVLVQERRKAAVWRVPVAKSVDVAVFGAPSGSVAAALAVKEMGRSVMAISDATYFGQETAGALQLWPTAASEHPLFARIFDGTGTPPTPTKVKHVLERALVDEGIDFLFDCRPVFALQGEQGDLVGLVLAARTSLYAVLCRVAVDMSRTGILARLTGLPLTSVSGPAQRKLVVIGPEPPADYGLEWEGLGEIPVPGGTEADGPYHAYRISLPITEPERSFFDRAGADCLARGRVAYPGVLFTADTWIETLNERLERPAAAGLYDEPERLPDGAFVHLGGRLVVANGLLPLTHNGAERLGELAGQLDLGRRAGTLAASLAADLPEVADRHFQCMNAAQSGSGETFRFAEPFLRPAPDLRWIDIHIAGVPELGSCDVLVVGGGTAGAPAAIGAAREGARTVVLERRHGLGGVGTLGLINSYYWGNRVGFTREVDLGLRAMSAHPQRINVADDPPVPARERLQDRPPGSAWNAEEKMAWYHRTLAAAGGHGWFSSFAYGVAMVGDKVTGVLVSTPFGAGLLRTKAVVDATGNADVAAAAGAPVRVLDAEHVAVQGTGLSPRRPSSRGRNSDHTFIDETDPVGITHAYVNARAKFKGEFDVAPIIGSRERRQIRGEIELSPLDFLAGRTFPDTIAQAWSNFDTHGFTVHPVFMVVPPDRTGILAHVPYRCLLPQGVGGVLVTGLAVSADRDALPVIRMQPDVQNQGFAAGLAAALAAKSGRDVREVDVRELQRRLVEAGVIDEDVPQHVDSFPLSDEVIRRAVAEGPTNHFNTAVIFAHQETTLPLLLEVARTTDDPQKREDAALVLGLCGRREVAGLLAEIVASKPWDEGWNFKGMSQFGPSLSRVDALVIALGRTRHPAAVEPVRQKILALDEHSEFSHCRAVSVAASALADPSLAEALFALLQKPGMLGHAHLDSATVIANANDELNENEARNNSLKELILGRGLYLCGDYRGLGRQILETYARDLRGHYARHAQAVLACRDLEWLRTHVV